jgi:PAS domain-containing protein
MTLEMKEDDFIVSKTDPKGRIIYVNKIFMQMAEYTEAELLGHPPQYRASSADAKSCL